MIYDIINSGELLARMQGINNWIEGNKDSIGNANMYEIMSCMIARNNIRVLEGKNDALDAEVERMISLRSDSINEFQTDVPESKPLFDAVRGGLTGTSREEMEFMCKCQSVPFFINNTRKRGFDGDITMPVEVQASKAMPNFAHDNYNEVMGMSMAYNIASEDVKTAAYPAVSWTVNNSVEALSTRIVVEPVAASGNSFKM